MKYFLVVVLLFISSANAELVRIDFVGHLSNYEILSSTTSISNFNSYLINIDDKNISGYIDYDSTASYSVTNTPTSSQGLFIDAVKNCGLTSSIDEVYLFDNNIQNNIVLSQSPTEHSMNLGHRLLLDASNTVMFMSSAGAKEVPIYISYIENAVAINNFYSGNDSTKLSLPLRYPEIDSYAITYVDITMVATGFAGGASAVVRIPVTFISELPPCTDCGSVVEDELLELKSINGTIRGKLERVDELIDIINIKTL